MPAPTNTTSATAIDLGQWPISFTQEVTFGGITYSVWYKVTPATSGMINLLAWGGGGTYIPELPVYDSDATSVIYSLSLVTEVPIQFPVVAGHTYYFFV